MQYKRWIYTISRHQSSYPDIASMRVKRNTNVEFIPSLGINHRTLISPRCVQNEMQRWMQMVSGVWCMVYGRWCMCKCKCMCMCTCMCMCMCMRMCMCKVISVSPSGTPHTPENTTSDYSWDVLRFLPIYPLRITSNAMIIAGTCFMFYSFRNDA